MSASYSLKNTIYAFYLLNGKMSHIKKPVNSFVHSFLESLPYLQLKKLEDSFSEKLAQIYQDLKVSGSNNILHIFSEWISFIYQDLETIDLINKGKISKDDVSKDIGRGSMIYMVLTLYSIPTIHKDDPKFFDSFSNQARFASIFKHFHKIMTSILLNPEYNPNAQDLNIYWERLKKSPELIKIKNQIKRGLGLYWTEKHLNSKTSKN